MTCIRRKFVEEDESRPRNEKKFVLVALVLALFAPGCATAGPLAKSKVKAAVESADLVEAAGIGAAAAAGDYKKAFDGVVSYAKRKKAAEDKANGREITEAQAAAALEKAGYVNVKTIFIDGIVCNDTSRITWEKKLVQTGSGATTPIEEVVASGDGSTLEDESAETDWFDVIVKEAEKQGIVLE